MLAGNDPNRSDKLQWRSDGNATTSFVSLGPILGAGDLRLCVYDESGSTAMLKVDLAVAGGGTCKQHTCWKPLGSTAAPHGYKYRNSEGNADGILAVKLMKVSSAPRILVKGVGSALFLPFPVSPNRYFAESPRVVAQLQTTSGICWEASYSGTAPTKNTFDRYRGQCTSCP